MNKFEHTSVLLEEAINILNPNSGGIYLDCTLGGGGHSLAILERSAPEGRLIGMDRDKEAILAAGERLNVFENRATLVCDNYVNFKLHLNSMGINKVDGILFDLGVSSHQLDRVERGFSYKYDAPLDMRMSLDGHITAADIVNTYTEDKLTMIIQEYGQERWARRIANFIIDEREKNGPLKTTGKLVEVIKAAIPKGARRDGPHPAKRTFQALRIAVNDELGGFEKALIDAIEVLKPGGRVCVITFHSLEDKIAKDTFRRYTGVCSCPPDIPICVCGRKKTLEILTKKPIVPLSTEIQKNPRARSAKLRAAEKCRE